MQFLVALMQDVPSVTHAETYARNYLKYRDAMLAKDPQGLLADPQATGSLYRPGALRAELDRFHAGASDPNAPYRLWGLAVLELWAREFHVEVPA